MNTVTSEPSSISDETKKDEGATECDAKPELVSDGDDIQVEPENDGNKEHKKSAKFKITIFMLCFASVVVSMDSVIVSAALPAITVSLNASSLEAFWIGTSYLLAQTVTVPLYGTISGIFGRKWVMIFALFLFMVGSILCATARSMNWLIGARVVQGLGGGGALSLVSIIITDITTFRERPKFLAFSSFAWALGTNIGVPVGGAIGEWTSWRWIFWINIPICVTGMIGLIYSLHLHQEITSLKSKLARIDYLGIAVFVASTTLLLFGLTTGGTSEPWSSAAVLAPLIIGFAGLGAFVIVEWKAAKAPMIPLRIFSTRTASAGFFGAFIHGLVLWTISYYMIIFFLGSRRDALFKSSAETLPGTAPVALSAVFIGIWCARRLRFQKMTWLAWFSFTIGVGLNALMKPTSGPFIIYILRIVAAIGAGWLFQLPLFAVQSTTVDDDLGIATASIVFFRSLGQAFGVAIGGTVFQNEFDRNVKRFVGEGRIGGGFVVTGAEAAGAYGAIGRFPVEVIDAYRYVYADSLRTVWYVTMALTAVAGLSSLTVRNLSMDRGNRSKQAFKHEEKSEKVVTV